MLKKILAILVMLYAAAAFAAVDANKATAAELDGVKGIGPAISGKIVEERKKGDFKDWDDLVNRVKGIGDKNAAKLSEGGLTVNGASFKGAAPAKKEAKAEAKADKKDVKAEAKADKKEAKATAKEEKAQAKDEAKADKKEADAKKDAKEAKAERKKAAKEAKADAKKDAASAAKPAASSKK